MKQTKKQITFLKPEHLAPIRSLSLRAKGIVEGLITGLHRSPYHGFSSEFLEYRPYLHGEPARSIDWRKYARTDKTVVRLFEDETNLYAHILLDKSASMDFNSTIAFSKFDYARTLAASLAWILIRQRDAVGLTLFDKQVEVAIPPRSTNLQLKTILSQLEHSTPGDETNCSEAIHKIAGTLKKRGLTILISDLFDDPGSIISAVRHLRFKRQDVMVIWILDPMEMDFKKDARLKIHDIETNEEILIDGETAAQFYNKGLSEHKTKIEHACKEFSVDLMTISTNEPFQKVLIRILEKRSKLF